MKSFRPRLLVITLLFCTLSHAKMVHDFKEILPDDFLTILYNPSSFKKKPDLIKGTREFYIKDAHKFALEIKRNNDAINYIHYTCTKSSNCPTIDFFKKNNPKSNFYYSKNEKNKYNGRYIILDDKKNGLQYYFKNDSKKFLQYIIYKKETKEHLK